MADSAIKQTRLPRSKAVLYALVRWTFVTFYWISLTQWWFGNSIFHRVLIATRVCNHINPDIESLNNFGACHSAGGSWFEIDISGHCL